MTHTLTLSVFISCVQVPLGEGAFAVVHRCVLRRSTHGGSNSGGNEHGHGEAGTDDRQSFAAPAPAPAPALEVVAVKQLKTNVLENEAELNAFVAEVDGEPPPPSCAICSGVQRTL